MSRTGGPRRGRDIPYGRPEAGATGADTDGDGQALPFSALQQRLGRKRVSEELIRRVPVAYLVFDVLYANGELLIDSALRERGKILDEILVAAREGINHEGHPSAPLRAGSVTGRKAKRGQARFAFEPEDELETRVIRAPVFRASSAQELDALFEAAQARGNEGLMIKNPESAYTPGRRGKSWLKLKRELATLDVVVTAAEYGHGKRIGVLSDYTFAVRDGERLVNIGKAYSGLTDVEIAEMTQCVSRTHDRGSGFSAGRGAEDCAGSGVQQHNAVRPA